MNEIRLAKVLGMVFIGVTALGLLGVAFARGAEQGKPPAPQAQGVAAKTAQGIAAPVRSGTERAGLYLAMALSIAGSTIGAGYAVGRVGAAAIGAVVERPDMLARSLIFVGLAEGIAIYGLLVALLLMKMG